jgi:hypothetical protein
MKKNSFLFLFLAWLTLALFLFVFISRFTYLQGFIWAGWQDFLKTMPQITPLTYLADLFKALVGLSLFTLASLGFGLGILRGLKFQASKVGMGITAFLVGEIAFSILLLTLLSLGELRPLWTNLILLAGLAWGAKPLWRYFRQVSRPTWPNQAVEKSILGLILAIITFSLFYSSARLGYDAAAEYFSHAKIMAQTGQPILLYPSSNFVVSALHPSILFTALIQLFGDQSARMLSWANGLIILLAGLEIGKQVGLSARARLYFLTLMLTSTAFVDLLGDGKVELLSTAPLVAALYWMLINRKTATRGTFLLIGLLLGFAIIARPYNIFLIPFFTILFYSTWAVETIRTQGWQPGARASLSVFWLAPPLLALGLFHLWQNWLWLGSPIAPLTYAQALDSSDWQWQFDPAILNILRLLYPLTVTFFNTPQSLGNITPLFVGFLPFLLSARLRARLELSSELRQILMPALVTLALWLTVFFTVVEIRYIFFLWIIFFLLGARLMETALDGLKKYDQALLRFSFIFLLAFVGLRTLIISLATYSPVDSNGQAHCFGTNFCTFLAPINQTSALGERVFVLNAYRYYLRPDLFACSSQAHEYTLLKLLAAQNSSSFWLELYRQGYSYITYEKNFAEFRIHLNIFPDPSQTPAWLTLETVSMSSDGAQIAYHLQVNNPPIEIKSTCIQNKAGLWEVITK